MTTEQIVATMVVCSTMPVFALLAKEAFSIARTELQKQKSLRIKKVGAEKRRQIFLDRYLDDYRNYSADNRVSDDLVLLKTKKTLKFYLSETIEYIENHRIGQDESVRLQNELSQFLDNKNTNFVGNISKELEGRLRQAIGKMILENI